MNSIRVTTRMITIFSQKRPLKKFKILIYSVQDINIFVKLLILWYLRRTDI